MAWYWFYALFFLGTLVLAAISAAMSFVFNPLSLLFVEVGNFFLNQIGLEPSGWGSHRPYILAGIIWPLTLAPLHLLNFKVLQWNTGAYVGLFAGTCVLLTFLMLLSKSGPLQLSRYSTEQLAGRYRKLRREAESTPRESWTENQHKRLGNWGGEMHDVMAELALRIKAQKYDETWVLANLGAPNKTVKEGENHIGETVPAGARWLIYNWRGERDHLIITLYGASVSDTRWYFAYERANQI